MQLPNRWLTAKWPMPRKVAGTAAERDGSTVGKVVVAGAITGDGGEVRRHGHQLGGGGESTAGGRGPSQMRALAPAPFVADQRHRAELVVAAARCGRSRSGAVKAQPETLTANAESARWRSNLYCAVRSATRVVPHHAFHERDRGPGCRPVGIIDKAVDSNVRARSNIECGPIDELEICASLFVGVHQIVLCDRCANGGGRSVSEYARLNRSSPTDSLCRGRPTHGEADCEGNPKCPFLSEP